MACNFPIFCVSNPEEAAASFVVYEKYEDSNKVVFQDDAIHVKMYTKRRAVVAMAPNGKEKEGDMDVAGEATFVRYRTATETGKKIARTLLKAVWKNERVGLCFSTFDISNIFVTISGKVKLKKVQRIKFSNLQLRLNHLAARQAIVELFSQNGSMPVDIQHLVDLIEKKPNMKSIYRMHASLVPIARSSLLFRIMYDHLKTSNIDKERKKQIVLGLPHLAGWKNAIGNNRLLSATYDFNRENINGGFGRYDHPPLSPQATQEEIDNRLLLEAWDFLDYLRNRGAHRMDYKLRTGCYTADGSDRASHVRFPLVMCYLQEMLFDQVVAMNLKEVV